MRAAEPSLPFVEEQVERLVGTFGKGPGDGFVKELQRALGGWSGADLEAAIDAVIRTEKRWPRIASILAARPLPRKVEGAPESGSSSACSLCGREPFIAGYETHDGRLFGRFRCGCPTGGGGWDTPRARAYRDPGQRDAAA